jgi:hypothetical protein
VRGQLWLSLAGDDGGPAANRLTKRADASGVPSHERRGHCEKRTLLGPLLVNLIADVGQRA